MSSYRARIEAFFEAAHNLRLYRGKPEPLHGHSWKVEVEVEAQKLDGEGMAMDFVELREALQALVNQVHYKYINEVRPFTDVAPSAENLARWFFDGLEPTVRSA